MNAGVLASFDVKLPSLLALDFDGLNFAVVAFVLDRYESYFRSFSVQLGTRLELARLKRNVLGNVHSCVIARVQPERAVGRRNLQPHFDPGTRHVAYSPFGIYAGMFGRPGSNSVDCG